mmetsp:Transcript_9442/g.8985  ORF Transcript_9442/g.8985 Transcript_9442/m.8985 type:complete len:99 (+) Transcript_9442:2437-2733(+)
MTGLSSGSSTSSSAVELDWTDFSSAPQNGGSPIISYIVYWDQGTDSWTELIGETSNNILTTYLKNTGISEGNSYVFKVAAKNIWGTGDFSSEFTIVAA